jgi:hypothetical protein
MGEKRYQLGYRFPTVATVPQGKPLPVSHGTPGEAGNIWVPIPWNAIDLNPQDPAQPTELKWAWSFLYGPCDFDVTAHVRVKNAQPECSLHLRLQAYRIDDGVETMVWGSEAPEKQVLPFENPESNTHLDFNWKGRLAEGERLRVYADYWNATDPGPFATAYIQGARVEAIYWRQLPD